MPLGMAYINAALRKAGLDVECINLNQVEEEDAYAVLADTVVKKDIDCVLCGGLSPHWKTLKKVFDTCKEAKPSVLTIGGEDVLPRTLLSVRNCVALIMP